MSLKGRIEPSFRPFSSSFANPQLRRLQLAGIGSTLGTTAYNVALAVYAYHAGGARAVGLLYFARWGVAAVAAPWLALLADRGSRRRVMLASDLARVGLVGGIAALSASHGPAFSIYVLAVAASVVATVFQPAQAALLPALAETPEELTSANVALSTVSSVGWLAGPALGGVLLAAADASTVFAVTAGALVWSAVCVLGVRPDRAREETADAPPLLASLLAGFRAIGAEPALRVVVGLTGAQTLVTGALEVLIVVVALRILDTGNASVGWLNAAFGAGGVLGAFAVAALVARRRLAGDLALGVVLWGVPIALLAAWANLGFALVLFAVIGVGNTLVDVAGMTLMQRSAEDEVLGRVFGVLESLILVGQAAGAAIAPALVALLAPRPALVLVGLVLPALVVVLLPKLRAIDAASHVAREPLELLRAIPMFAALPGPALERLASAAVPVTVPRGTTVFSRGDLGDRFYVIEAGRMAVDLDGTTRELGPGESLGEIALLRAVPRTATVRALEDSRLYALRREEFVPAVTGHAPTEAAADRVIAARMPVGTVRAGGDQTRPAVVPGAGSEPASSASPRSR